MSHMIVNSGRAQPSQIDKTFSLHAATLQGHQRFSIKGRMYPALAHATSEDMIQGKVHQCMLQCSAHTMLQHHQAITYADSS